jgi:hypothetical protein
MVKSSSYDVAFQELSATNLSAHVTHRDRENASQHDVSIVLGRDAAVILCCGFEKEHLRPCVHMVAAILGVPRQQAGPWSQFDLRFFGRVWHTATWRTQLSNVPIAIDISNAQLGRDASMRPWQRPPKVIGCFCIFCC